MYFCLALLPGCFEAPEPEPVAAYRQALARFGISRPTLPRLSIDGAHQPCPQLAPAGEFRCAAVAGADLDARLARTILSLSTSAHGKALAPMLFGASRSALDRSIELLEHLATDPASSETAVTVDLSAAFLARFELAQDPEDLLRAIEVAGPARRAAQADPRLLFNLALATSRLQLFFQARELWLAYADQEQASGWAEEARAQAAAIRLPGKGSEDLESTLALPDGCRGMADQVPRLQELLESAGGDPALRGRAYGIRGLAASCRGRHFEALEAYRQAVAAFEASGRQAHRAWGYALLAENLELQGLPREALAARWQALQGLAVEPPEQGSRVLLDAAKVALGAGQPFAAELFVREAMARAPVARKGESAALLTKVLATQAAKATPGPAFREGGDDEAEGSMERLGSLPAGEAVLRFARRGERLAGWCANSEGLQFSETTLSAADAGLLEAAPRGGMGRESLENLHRLFLGPFPECADAADLTFVVDSVLAEMPIAAFVDPATGRYLVQDHRITHVLAMPQPFAGRKARAPRRASSNILLVDASESPAADLFGLPALAGDGREVREIAALHPGATVLGGEEATAAKTRRALRDQAILHFSGYGESRMARGPWLFFAADAEDVELAAVSGPDLARWPVHDLDLVFLAGAVGGQDAPQAARSGGVAPFAEVFLRAGARTLVGALWRLDDDLLLDLSVEFYRRLRAGDPPAEALRQSQLLELARNRAGAGIDWAALQVYRAR